MAEQQIRFDDGAAYERFMGYWSRLAGDVFLDWLSPPPGLRWLDVGCGNGAFTELLVGRCEASQVDGLDPSSQQIAFAQQRPCASLANFRLGDAQNMPYADASFDAAIMALVIFFVPDPARGLAEMCRVVRPGGVVAAYAWDVLAGIGPGSEVREELAALGKPSLLPPSADASRLANMEQLWTQAGLVEVESRQITVERSFADFEALWQTTRISPALAPLIRTMEPDMLELLRQRLQARIRPQADGTLTCSATANAVKGKVAG